METRLAGAGVEKTAVNPSVAGSTATRVAVTRLDRAAAAVEAGRRQTGVEELTRVAEEGVGADTAVLDGGHVDARSTMLAVGLGTRTGSLTPISVVPFSTYAPVATSHARHTTASFQNYNYKNIYDSLVSTVRHSITTCQRPAL